MKTVLITGANRGIGFETAKQLGKLGYFVFFTARDKKTGEKTFIKSLIEGMFVQMDITDLNSINKAFELISKRKKSLDVLINNAGVLLDSDNNVIDFDDKTLYETFNTNVFGALKVTRKFSRLLKSGSRIINVSSGGGSMNDEVGGWAPLYCVTKSALNSVTKQSAYELRRRNIAVNSVCPGWVRTEMGGRGATRSMERGAETIVWLAHEAPLKLTGRFFRDKKEIEW
jgi:NAD(P)-dependent dehydrogenase (short-subunit alcohol dehydrogenase family)